MTFLYLPCVSSAAIAYRHVLYSFQLPSPPSSFTLAAAEPHTLPLPPLRDPWASARDTKHSSSGEKGRLPADLLPPGLRPKEGKRVGGHFSELVKKESYTDFFFFF